MTRVWQCGQQMLSGNLLEINYCAETTCRRGSILTAFRTPVGIPLR